MKKSNAIESRIAMHFVQFWNKHCDNHFEHAKKTFAKIKKSKYEIKNTKKNREKNKNVDDDFDNHVDLMLLMLLKLRKRLMLLCDWCYYKFTRKEIINEKQTFYNVVIILLN